MKFKERLEELKHLQEKKDIFRYAADGATLCYETLKTSKLILEDIMGSGNYDAKDVLDVYAKLVGCEIESSLKELQDQFKSRAEDIDLNQILQLKKKINNLS